MTETQPPRRKPRHINRAQRRALAFGQVSSQAAILRGLVACGCLTPSEDIDARVALHALGSLQASIRAGFKPREDE